jgi:hypothetical protein
MARRLRILMVGGWYHAVNRRHHRSALFLEQTDRNSNADCQIFRCDPIVLHRDAQQARIFPERGLQSASRLAGTGGSGINSALLSQQRSSSEKPVMRPRSGA